MISMRVLLTFVRVVRIGSKSTLLCVCQKLLVFSVSTEIDMVLVMVEIGLISVWAIELKLILV